MRISHYMAALKQHLEQRTKVRKYKYVELGVKRMDKDEDAVQMITDGIHAWVPKLWSPTSQL